MRKVNGAMKRMINSIIYTPLILSVLAGCSTNKHSPTKLSESFSANILSSGEKQFQFQISLLRPEGRRGEGNRKPPKGQGRPPRGKQGSPANEVSSRSEISRFPDQQGGMEAKLMERLNARILESGYCRDGFKIVDKDLGWQGRFRVRGQCNELATNQDREQFSSLENKPQIIYETLDRQ